MYWSLFCLTLYGMGLKEQYQFWVLAICVGLFQGAIQSLSRSYFARIIPPEKSGEYFGLYDICGKGASFLGTFTVSFVSQAAGSVNLGVGALAFMFALGHCSLSWPTGPGKRPGLNPSSRSASPGCGPNFKAQVHGLNAVQPHIWGDNKAVYYIKLGRLILSRVVGPVQQAAGGGGAVIGPDAVLRQEAVIQAAGIQSSG